MLMFLLAQLSEYKVLLESTIKYFGLGGAVFLGVLLAYHRKWIFSGREVIKIEDTCTKQIDDLKIFYEARIAEIEESYNREIALIQEQCKHNEMVWKERYEDLRAHTNDSLERIRHEKDMWRESAVKGLNVAETAVKKKMAGG